MNPEVKKEWLEALRSNKYRQGQTCLRKFSPITKDNLYCCLGVLCDISQKFVWEEVPPANFLRYGNEVALPPFDVRQWAGLDKETTTILAAKNDAGSTFAELADYIENNL